MSSSPGEARAAAGATGDKRPQSLSEVVKFTALAAMLAIFFDAALAHAMIWGNDPYWTYWVTDTLLMATVFGLGTMLFGIGLGRGALITAVHVTLLTIYYWSLSPIGLPSHPEWLDLEHTWITGLPVHLTVYYFGYVAAFWLWGRHSSRRRELAEGDPDGDASSPSLPRIGLAALVVAAAIVIVTGLLQSLALQDFPGLTWFIMRIAVAFPFTVAWWMMAGNDRSAAVGGGIALALLLTTYSHFLAPTGLPNEAFRLFEQDSPPAVVQWLSYGEEFLVMLPISAIVAIMAFWLAARWHQRRDGEEQEEVAGGTLLTSARVAIVLGVVTLLAASHLAPEANRTRVTSVGMASVERAAGDLRLLDLAAATLSFTAEDRDTHKTPLPPHDGIDLVARIPGSDGAVYDIRATQPMVSDPAGRFTTWSGVGFGKWHDGRSGIGLARLPPTYANVVAFALGEVRVDGRLVASGIPLQVVATSGDPRHLHLQVGDESAPVAQIADRVLRVTWQDYVGGQSRSSKEARYVFGGAVLLLLFGLTFAAARRESFQVHG